MSTCCLIWVVNFIELGDTQEIGMSSKVLLETIGVWLSKLKGRSLFWRAEGTHLNSLTTANKHYKQVAIFHYLLLHPLRPPDNYWSPSGDDVSVSFSFGNGWVDRCNTLKEQLYRSLENVPAAANTNGQTKDDNRLIPHVSIKCGLKSLPIPDLSMADTENPQPTC
nr:uncharacterized protein LOC108350772 isoform X2 [Rattus norvegicus]XP_038964777.1 uncharacterized protein LOC108350772 isoform X2 [Rattus norvegicus]|eukprot:XP_017448543.1 PREDICTED: uncharacterized protein LOC108350772 isoform X3 [Rattus norvegicus]